MVGLITSNGSLHWMPHIFQHNGKSLIYSTISVERLDWLEFPAKHNFAIVSTIVLAIVVE